MRIPTGRRVSWVPEACSGPAKPAAATDYHNLAPVEPEQRREVNRIESRKLARTWHRGNLVPPDGPRRRGMGTAAKPPPEPGT